MNYDDTRELGLVLEKKYCILAAFDMCITNRVLIRTSSSSSQVWIYSSTKSSFYYRYSLHKQVAHIPSPENG